MNVAVLKREARWHPGRARAARRILGRTAIWVAVLVFCAVAIIPFLYLVSTSFKEQRDLFSYPPEWIPSEWFLGNYERLLFERPFLRWTLNTFFVAGTITLLKVIFDSMAAYAFAKMDFFGKRALFFVLLSAVMVPISVLIIPLFFLVRSFGLLDTYWALILPPLANPVGIFMLRAFIQTLPDDIENAARVDNCNPFQIYWHVILPLVKPGLVVVAIYTFYLQYTNFVWPVVVTRDENLFLLTNGLASLHTTFFLRDWGLISAASMLAMVPITFVFLLFQRQFVAASLAGALKE
jgi:multiple sugar transport system permease protein